jgi:hypothetical protein
MVSTRVEAGLPPIQFVYPTSSALFLIACPSAK